MSFVTVKLHAQLGNQMFMIANCIAHALKHGVEYKIPRQGHSPELPEMPFTHLPEWTPADGLGAPYVEEEFGVYHEIPYWPKMRMGGYFQSEKYFKEYRKEILDAFRIPYIFTDGVSLHVRRTDYLNHPTKHPVVNHDYFTQALKIFTEKGYNTFTVFSDDIQWAKDYFTPTFPDLKFNYIDRNPDGRVNMGLMSGYAHNIIANSTYSWWAAWLNQNPDKIIITPSEDNWFGEGNKHLKVTDVIPLEWIRLKF